jgi:cobalt-zinc-cadmium efflux system outer membrane protein
VAVAVKQNPRLSAAAREVAAARESVRSARALANPELTFIPNLTRGGSDEELLLRQPLELNGTRSARAGIASAQLRQTQAQAVVELRALVFETKTSYYGLAQARELLTVSQDLLKSAEEFDRITRRQVEEGLRPGIDRTQTGIEVTRAQQQAMLAASRVRAAEAALNTLLGQAPDQAIPTLSPLIFSPVKPDLEAVAREALAQRAEIQAQEAVRDASRGEARLARAQGRPDLVPQFRAESVTRSGPDPGIGLGISLPLFDYGSRRHRIRQAEETTRAQTDRIEGTRNDVRRDVEQAIARLQGSDSVVASYQQGLLDQARKLLEASRAGFQSGLTSVVGVLEAQRTYRSVLIEYTNALVEHALARAELERAVGSVSPSLLPAVSEGKKPR